MTKSSASFIAYELRPGKQTERRILLDYLESLKEAGVQVSSARYIGMGGTKFYDFAMMHRFLGITDLVSCERNPQMAKRAAYNRPFSRIEVLNQEVGTYLQQHLSKKLSVCWLDYDDSLKQQIVDDIRTAGREARIGSSVFVTVASELPRNQLEYNEAERLAELRSEYGDFSSDVSEADVEDASYGNAIVKILSRVFTNAFSGRAEGKWYPYFRIEYKDSTKMLTIGGSFLQQSVHRRLKPVLQRRLPFLKIEEKQPYKIRLYNITERERHLFEFAASAKVNCREANKLRDLGFKDADLEGYRELVRFLPRYFEAYA